MKPAAIASVDLTITLELGTRWSAEEKVDEIIRQASRDAREAVLKYVEDGRQRSSGGTRMVRCQTGAVRVTLEAVRS